LYFLNGRKMTAGDYESNKPQLNQCIR